MVVLGNFEIPNFECLAELVDLHTTLLSGSLGGQGFKVRNFEACELVALLFGEVGVSSMNLMCFLCRT